MNQQWFFLAPRSNETSRKNFLSTLSGGYPAEEIQAFLSEEEKRYLGPRKKFYIWGNEKAKRGSWLKLKLGDFVAFYAKGSLVYAGLCIFKKHSPAIAQQLWGNVPGKEVTWEYVFFLDSLRPINIPISVIKDLASYKEKFVVQGFMPLNENGMRRIDEVYGGLSSFFDAYSTGLNAKDISTLEEIAKTAEAGPVELEEIDKISSNKDFDALLMEWQHRKGDQPPEEVERKVKAIKRNVAIVKQMKQKYENKCQICGFTFKQKNGEFYSEVAHIIPLSSKKAGVDRPNNMIVLCPNHHKTLDFGDMQIVSENEYVFEGKKNVLLRPLIRWVNSTDQLSQ